MVGNQPHYNTFDHFLSLSKESLMPSVLNKDLFYSQWAVNCYSKSYYIDSKHHQAEYHVSGLRCYHRMKSKFMYLAGLWTLWRKFPHLKLENT